MTDPDLLAKRLAVIDTCVRELRELARADAIRTDVRDDLLEFGEVVRERIRQAR